LLSSWFIDTKRCFCISPPALSSIEEEVNDDTWKEQSGKDSKPFIFLNGIEYLGSLSDQLLFDMSFGCRDLRVEREKSTSHDAEQRNKIERREKIWLVNKLYLYKLGHVNASYPPVSGSARPGRPVAFHLKNSVLYVFGPAEETITIYHLFAPPYYSLRHQDRTDTLSYTEIVGAPVLFVDYLQFWFPHATIATCFTRPLFASSSYKLLPRSSSSYPFQHLRKFCLRKNRRVLSRDSSKPIVGFFRFHMYSLRAEFVS